MDEETLNKYKEKLFSTMRAFINFCKQNNIRYFACSGTAIGAVRHKGCIPWDDDIDVLMLRKDYDKMLAIRHKLEGTGYNIIHHTDKGYPLPFAKFCDASTTLWERKEHPFIEGVYLDIMPLDEASDDVELSRRKIKTYQRSWRKYEYSIAHYSVGDIINAAKHHDWILVGHIILCWAHYRWHRNTYYAAFLECEREARHAVGNRLAHYYCSYAIERELFRKEWFSDTVSMPYEDFEIDIPKDYKPYLTQLFGDYMTPPPEGNRRSYHKHYYLDLNKRVEKKDIKL